MYVHLIALTTIGAKLSSSQLLCCKLGYQITRSSQSPKKPYYHILLNQKPKNVAHPYTRSITLCSSFKVAYLLDLI